MRKLHHCDGCGKERADVRSCGRDAAGMPDAPDLCFLCREEESRGRIFNRQLGRYVHASDDREFKQASWPVGETARKPAGDGWEIVASYIDKGRFHAVWAREREYG